MDFSLLQHGSKNKGLRDILALENHKWMYYTIIIVDPILRFGWVFLAVFSRSIQHGSIVALCVAFLEVTRRGLWTIFRVENEHSTNIALSKASRDIPLPFKLRHDSDESTNISASLIQIDQLSQMRSDSQSSRPEETGEGTVEARKRSSLKSRHTAPGSGVYRALSRRLARAHTEDFQRKKKPELMEQHQSVQEQDQTLQDDGVADIRDEDDAIEEESGELADVNPSRERTDVYQPPPA